MKRGAALASCLAIVFVAQPAATEAQAARPDSGLLQAILLPTVAQTLRDGGIPDADVKVAVVSARNSNVAAGDLTVVFRQTVTTVQEHGPIENFGAFVQQQLRAGLRGQALAQAIRAEHARRGIGRGHSFSGARGARGHGRSGEAHGKAQGREPMKRTHADASAPPRWLANVAAAAAAIEAKPTAADSILQARGLTRATFNARLYEVAADPELTAAYREVVRR
ncbi:MAG: hypothetical protein P8099_01170 [Gemmatimonadota bacterium]